MFSMTRYLEIGFMVFTIGVISMCGDQKMIEDSMDMKKQIDGAIDQGEYTTATQLITQYLGDETLLEQTRSMYEFDRTLKKSKSGFYCQT